MIKEEYEKLQKKHNLPSYDDVNNELEISSLESEEFLLRQIRNKVADRIELIAGPLASILQPSAESMVDMHECRFFDDKEKIRIIDIYKKLMIVSRSSLEADISHDENDDAFVIVSFFKEWPSVRKEVLEFLKKMKSCWEKETEIEENLGYFV